MADIHIPSALFEEKLAPEGNVEDGCHPEEAQALQEYDQGKITAEEAAYAITRPIETAEEPGNHLHRLWGLLTDALVEWPSAKTPALIRLLDEIEKLPEPTHLTADPRANASLPHGPLWKGLPGFGHQWSDEHKWGEWRNAITRQIDPTERNELRSRIVNIAGIEAQVAIASEGRILPLDWGYECISDALEYSGAVLDFEIPMAAEWFKVAARRIYEGAVKGERSWAFKKHDLWQGEEMSLARWSSWESHLQQVVEGEQ
ncbi:hypothetical protein VTN77DRAFT_562 [Rasamsonia byssochlamydoides]|uniref:uncharacterized protein n=1 Tax=Rasamsonia byssochlamydoides TaxID=89139 RepID=UPI00374493EB